jgi:hypothetical protein
MAEARSHPTHPPDPGDRSLASAPADRWSLAQPAQTWGLPGGACWLGAPSLGAPWLRGPIAWARLGLGLASLALLCSPTQVSALPPATTAKPAEPGPGNRGPAGPAGGFGHWQSGTRSCSRNLAGSPQSPCQLVQLNQQLEGLLTVRFIAPGAQKDSLNQLIVVGLLQPSSQPLLCQQGRCQPDGPLSTLVSTVSERSFDGRGLAQGLPKSWLASGTCRFEDRRVRCQATAPGGEHWQAEASF